MKPSKPLLINTICYYVVDNTKSLLKSVKPANAYNALVVANNISK